MTKAMIFAAGRGERMGALTQECPKPLLLVRGRPLISYHLKKLAAIGVKDCLINLHYLGEQIRETLGDGSDLGINIHYSHETEKLETAGGIVQALNFFDDQPFILISGDIVTDYPFERLLSHSLNDHLAHLVMIDNPSHHQAGEDRKSVV